MRPPTSRKDVTSIPEPEGEHTTAACRVELLGRFLLVRGTHSVSRFRTQKTGGLLAYLAYHADRSHSRELLADRFWPEATPDSARHSLRLALSDLRRLLDPREGTSSPADTVLLADRSQVQMRPGAIQTDVAAFERALDRLAPTRDPDERRRLLETTVDLYTGPLLPGMYEPWVAPQQMRLEERYVDAILELIALLEAAGNHASALRRVRQASLLVPDCHEFAEAEQRFQQRQIPVKPGLQEAPTPSDATFPFLESRIPSASGTLTLMGVDDGAVAGDELFTRLAQRHGGTLLRAEPAPYLLAFSRARDALAALESFQQTGHLRRAALHTGEFQARKEGGPRDPTSDEAPLHLTEALLTATPQGTCVCTEATAHLLRPALLDPTHLALLGAYRLPGTATAERIFRLSLRGASANEPAPVLQAPRANEPTLPIPLTRFFGREADLAVLIALLTPGELRLVTLTGIGGIGKTRLALEAAHRLAVAFAGGIRCFVSLTDITDPALVTDVVRRALGLPPPGPGLDPRDQLVDALRAYPTAFLLLDNVEHLLGERDNPANCLPALVTNLLDRLPSLVCLVTSRRSLGLPGEYELPVQPLATPEALAEGSESPSVALFVDRATAARPDFSRNSRNTRAVEELCRQLEGVPLSLELAAARVSALSPAQMLGQLGDRLDLLTRRGGGGAARHRSLRGAVQWSFDLLTTEQKAAFAQLSVFRGGWEVDAAAAVWEVSRTHAFDLLDDLRSHSLLVTEETGERMRYRMLETLRAFAQEQLTDDARRQGARWHAQHYFARAEIARRAVESPAISEQELRALDRAMEAEDDNVRAALAFCSAGTAEDRHQGLWLAVSMTPRWYWRGRLIEGRQWLETCFAAAQESAVPLPGPLEGAAQMSLGLLHRIVGHAQAARQELQRAVEILEAYPEDEYLPWAHHILSVSLLDNGEYADMQQHNLAAEAIWARRGHTQGVALSRYNEGLVQYRHGEVRQAEATVAEAARLCRASGNALYLSLSLELLGCILNDQARHDNAIACYQEALDYFREHNIGQFVAITLRDEGVAHLCCGDYAAALTCGAEAERIFVQTGGQYGASTTRFWNAQAHLYRDAPGDKALGEALLARIEADATRGIGVNLPIYTAFVRATLVLHRSRVKADLQAGLSTMQVLLGRFLEQDSLSDVACCLEYLAGAHQKLDDPKRAARLLHAADSLRAVLGSQPAQSERRWLEPLRQELSTAVSSSDAELDHWHTTARREADAASS